MTDRSAKMLERVRALLAKAADPGIPQAEADLFRQKADELMTTYAIEAWMVEREQQKIGAPVQPERRDINVAWRRDNPFANQLGYMFAEVARHCRCIAPPKLNYNDYTKPVFGVPSDLDWFDLLFTSL